MPTSYLGSFNEGESPKLVFPFAVDGTPTDPTTAPFRLKAPSGLKYDLDWPDTPGDLVHDTTGTLSIRPVLNEPGFWHGEIRGTGAVIAVVRFSFDVEPSDLFP